MPDWIVRNFYGLYSSGSKDVFGNASLLDAISANKESRLQDDSVPCDVVVVSVCGSV